MKLLKRLFVLVLVFTLVLSSVPTVAFAEEIGNQENAVLVNPYVGKNMAEGEFNVAQETLFEHLETVCFENLNDVVFDENSADCTSKNLLNIINEYEYHQSVVLSDQPISASNAECNTLEMPVANEHVTNNMANRQTTKASGTTTITNYNILRNYISTYGTVNSDGYKMLVRMSEVGAYSQYYYSLTNYPTAIYFNLLTSSSQSTCIATTTGFFLTDNSRYIDIDSIMLYYNNGDCVDAVKDELYTDRATYTTEQNLYSYESGRYITSSDFSKSITQEVALLCLYWDEYIYTYLGFGLRGLGFLSYNGYGSTVCDPIASYHLGRIGIANQIAAGCVTNGYTGDTYCLLCNYIVSYGSVINSVGYHVYDNTCDGDCNICGEKRSIVHTYSGACDAVCNVCDYARNTIGDHSFGTNGYCVGCGRFNSFTIAFKNWDGTVIAQNNYQWGDVIEVPTPPTKESDKYYVYNFEGWDNPVVNCAGDAMYTAVYNRAYIDYIVRFLHEDGSVISSRTYHYGESVVLPTNPTKESDELYDYFFAGWDKSVTVCTGNADYVAKFTKEHEHGYTKTVVEPTITQGGYTEYVCKCGDFYRQNYTSATGLMTPSVKIEANTVTGKTLLVWGSIEQATSYEIYRATSKSGKYSLVGTVETTTWQDTSASVGKTYYYKVKAVYAEDISLNSSFSSIVSAATKCATPELSVKAGSTGKPVLSWNKITGAKKYEIWRSVDGGAFKKLTTSTKLTYTDSKATAGAECTYKVKALGSKSSYNGEFSSTGSCYVTCAAPSVTLKLDSKTGIPALSWKKITGAKSYAIYRSANSGEYELLTTTTAVSYKDSTVQADNKYSYYVVTLGKAEVFNSVPSAAKSVTLAVKAPKLSGSATAEGKPMISWTAAENTVAYEVYRSTKSSKGFELIATVTELSYTDTTVATGKTFYYKVVAVGTNTESAQSSYLKQVGKCATPTIQVAVDETNGKPIISWEKIEGAKKYTVYRATSENGKYSKLGTSTKLTYTDSKASVGTKYFYKIVANPSSSSANSNYSNIESCLCICAKAVITAKVDTASGKPSLSWKKVTGAKTYAIYRSENGGEYILVATQTAVSYKDTTAVAGNAYSYQVKVIASKTGADSLLSAEKTVSATCAQPKLKGKVGATGKPELTWGEVESATKYVIYRSTSKSKGYTVLNETEDLSFTDTTAVKSKTYYYKIVAICDDIQSAQSAYVKVKSK